MAKSKKLIMSDYELTQAFEKYKDRPEIQEAITKGYEIYLRPNGFMTINPMAKIAKKIQKVLDTQYMLYD